MNRKVLLSLLCLSCVHAFADNITANSTAQWQATANKDTESTLVVSPLGSLNFQYAAGAKSFNSLDGNFNVTIQGITGASDFKLTSKLISNELVRPDDPSKLTVGVSWNGKTLSKSQEVVIIDTGNGIRSGLVALSDPKAYASKLRNSAQGNFGFTIANATDAKGQKTQIEQLKDGLWTGEVAVQFTAVWAK